MSKLKDLSGKDVIKILNHFQFDVVSQKGSHVKLMRNVAGHRQILTVPDHDDLDKGTLRAIIRQASRYVLEEELRKQFYTSD